MIETNIILSKNDIVLKIKTEEKTNYIKTYCIISSVSTKTTITNNFNCNKDISVVQYKKLLNRQIIPLIRDFNILIQGI